LTTEYQKWRHIVFNQSTPQGSPKSAVIYASNKVLARQQPGQRLFYPSINPGLPFCSVVIYGGLTPIYEAGHDLRVLLARQVKIAKMKFLNTKNTQITR
jgi:hypothetical protein